MNQAQAKVLLLGPNPESESFDQMCHRVQATRLAPQDVTGGQFTAPTDLLLAVRSTKAATVAVTVLVLAALRHHHRARRYSRMLSGIAS